MSHVSMTSCMVTPLILIIESQQLFGSLYDGLIATIFKNSQCAQGQAGFM